MGEQSNDGATTSCSCLSSTNTPSSYLPSSLVYDTLHIIKSYLNDIRNLTSNNIGNNQTCNNKKDNNISVTGLYNEDWLENELIKVKEEMKEIKDCLATKTPSSPSEDKSKENFEAALAVVVSSRLIKPKRVLLVSMTSKGIFNLLSPIISKYAFSQSTFHHHKPTKLINVTKLPVAPHINNITFDAYTKNMKIKDIPASVTSLTIPFNQRLELLSPSITHLKLSHDFNLKISSLPPSLYSLEIDDFFDHPISCLPPSLVRLKFGYYFNSSPNPLPKNLQYLTFGDCFDKTLDNLPTGLKYLKFGTDFNQPLPSPLPQLSHLIFENATEYIQFNQPLLLPNSITHLIIGNNDYYHPISAEKTSLVQFKVWSICDISSPSSLFDVTTSFASSIPLPESTRFLEIVNTTIDEQINWPPNIFHLSFYSTRFEILLNWPNTLTRLSFRTSEFNLPIFNLPLSLSYLHLSDGFDENLDDLPPNLKELITGKKFNQSVNNLPSSLLSLTFGNRFNQPIDHLPPFLSYLETGKDFDQPVDNLPPSLIILNMRLSNFNHPIDQLPETLEKLEIGDKFAYTIKHLPPSLTVLSTPSPSLKHIYLPPSITNLKLSPIFVKHFYLNIPPQLKKLFLDLPNYAVQFDLISLKMTIEKIQNN